MWSVTFLLVLSAFVATIASTIWKVPLWVAVLLLTLVELLRVLPR